MFLTLILQKRHISIIVKATKLAVRDYCWLKMDCNCENTLDFKWRAWSQWNENESMKFLDNFSPSKLLSSPWLNYVKLQCINCSVLSKINCFRLTYISCTCSKDSWWYSSRHFQNVNSKAKWRFCVPFPKYQIRYPSIILKAISHLHITWSL